MTLLDLAFDLLLGKAYRLEPPRHDVPACQGQAQLKAGTSSTWRIGELQLTAVRGGQPPGDVETKPEPTAVAGRRRVQAHMTLEDPVAIGQRDPRPLILDGHQRVPAVSAGR